MITQLLKRFTFHASRFWSDDRNIWLAIEAFIIIALLVLIGVSRCDVSPRGVLGPRWPPATPTPSDGVTITSNRDGTTLHAFSISDADYANALFTFRANIVDDTTGKPLTADVEVTTSDGERALHSGVDYFEVSFRASKVFTVTVTAPNRQPWGLQFNPRIKTNKILSGVIRLKPSGEH